MVDTHKNWNFEKHLGEPFFRVFYEGRWYKMPALDEEEYRFGKKTRAELEENFKNGIYETLKID